MVLNKKDTFLKVHHLAHLLVFFSKSRMKNCETAATRPKIKKNDGFPFVELCTGFTREIQTDFSNSDANCPFFACLKRVKTKEAVWLDVLGRNVLHLKSELFLIICSLPVFGCVALSRYLGEVLYKNMWDVIILIFFSKSKYGTR